jgi:excisionase family DNA binding protein
MQATTHPASSKQATFEYRSTIGQSGPNPALSLAEAPDVLTVAEVARLLRIGRNTAYELVRNGDLYAARIGNCLRIPKLSIERYLVGEPQINPPA